MNDKKNRSTPQELINNPNIISFCCGESHSMLLTKGKKKKKKIIQKNKKKKKKNLIEGKLFMFGNNKNGQIGVELIPEQKIPLLVLKNNKITKICCGMKHSMALTSDGEVYVNGFNQYGQLGLGHTMV